jgi:outer membrane protein
LAVRNADLERKLAKAQFCPDVSLFASLNTINANRDFPNPTNKDEFAVGVQGSVPLFAGGRRMAQRREADHHQEQARETLQAARNLVGLEVQEAFLEYQEMSARLPLSKAAMNEATVAEKSYDAEGRLGVEDKDQPKYFENLLTTGLLLTQAQVGYYQHLYGYNLALAKIRLVTATDESATPTAAGGTGPVHPRGGNAGPGPDR